MGISKYKLIVLDRDGVINYESREYIKSPEEWLAIPGSLEAITRLNKAGCKVAVASNQSGLARKLYDEPTLQKIHQKMLDQLQQLGGHLDAISYCPHHPRENCDCRKPKPKMLLDLIQRFDVTPQETLFIGDRETDGETAKNAGCDFIRVTEKRSLADIVDKSFNNPDR